MLIPSDFSLMSGETLAVKYPSAGHRPTEVYTNKTATINIALNHTANKATEKDLQEVKKAMESQFHRPPFTLIKSDLKEINGAPHIILEFESPARDARIYNLMAIGILDQRLVMTTFNCTEEQRSQWEDIGRKIITSIKLKK